MLSGALPFNFKKVKKNKINDNSQNLDNNEISLSSNSNNNNNFELQYSIVNKSPKHIEKISDEARDLLHGLLNKDPAKRLTIDQILNHPWLKSEGENNDINENNKYKLFTKAEMIMLSKNYIDYRIKGNDDLKEIFTLSNLNDSNDGNKNQNIKTKSSILAPYNTLIENESYRINDDGDIDFDNGELFSDFNNSKIQLENNIINLGIKVKQLYINYELNNNGELDNGMIIQTKSKSNTFCNLSMDESKSNMNNSEEKKSNKFEECNDIIKKEEMKKKKILDIIENFGYDKKYVINCVKNNKLCHASAVYYLLMNYENL
jgi:serine/threonine protein kinase